MNLNRPLILASKSPRRQQILREAGFEFTVSERELDETYPDTLPLREVPEYLARRKAEMFAEEARNALVITADTVVILDDAILGKPVDTADAFRMLRSLSGKTHTVVTGVCLYSDLEMNVFSESTRVYFAELSDKEIADYIEHYKPFDKAGAYGIQEYIGMIGIRKIEGSYWNVMGLPVHRVYRELKKIGIIH